MNMEKERFAEMLINGKASEALNIALRYYKGLKSKAEKVLDRIDLISVEELEPFLEAFPYDFGTRILIYMALKGTKGLENIILDRVGYLDFKEPDIRALESLGFFQSSFKSSNPDRYLRYLRESFVPFRLPICSLTATAVSILLKEGTNSVPLFSRTLSLLKECRDDFKKAKLVVELIKSMKGKKEAKLLSGEIIELQRGILYDHERGKILVNLCHVVSEDKMLDRDFSKSLLLMAREIETPSFKYWTMMEIAKDMKKAGLGETAMGFLRRIENPFWQGAIAYELLKNGDLNLFHEALSFVKDPFWKLLIELKDSSRPEKEEKIIRDFISNDFIPPSIRLESLRIVKDKLSDKTRKITDNFLKSYSNYEVGFEEQEDIEKAGDIEEEVNIFLSLSQPEREAIADSLVRKVIVHPMKRRFKKFFSALLQHPGAVETIISEMVKKDGKQEAERVVEIIGIK